MLKIQADVAVIGGGPAGVCAALSAARHCADTVLIGNRPVLGGNSSSEIRVWTRGALGAGNVYAEEMGIWGELKLTNLYRNPDGNPSFWDDCLLDAVLEQERLGLLLNTEITDLKMAGDRILSLEGHQQGSEGHILVEAKTFIDATGDGTLGAKAGVPYYIGGQRIDPAAPAEIRDHQVLGSSILFFTRKEDHPVSYVPPHYAYDMDYIASLVGRGGRILSEKMGGSDCWWFEYGGHRDTIGDFQDITIELKRLVMGIWNYIKNSGRFHAENYTLEWVGNFPGKRESRRLETAYILKEEDIRNGRTFADGGFYGGWYVDMHPSGGVKDSAQDNCVQTPVKIYQIPIRCLYTGVVPNLLLAGRDIGTDRNAFASARILNVIAGKPADGIPVAPFVYSNIVRAWKGDAQADVISGTIEFCDHFGFDIIHRNMPVRHSDMIPSENWQVSEEVTAPWVWGVFNYMAGLRSLEDLITDPYEDPKFYEELAEFALSRLKTALKPLLEEGTPAENLFALAQPRKIYSELPLSIGRMLQS